MLELDMTVGAFQEHRVSMQLVQANRILEMTSLELQQAIADEILDNPALERLEAEGCPVCGTVLVGSLCPTCLTTQKGPTPPDDEDLWADRSGASERMTDPSDFDPMTQVADQMSLAEYLARELGAAVAPAVLPIGEYLIGNLDDRGYLTINLEDVAETFGVEVDVVEGVLQQLQQLEPAGIGARDLRECLLIQVTAIERERGADTKVVRQIIDHHLDELGGHHFARIASALKVSLGAVGEAAEFIRRELNPAPAHQFAGNDRNGPILPDVLIRKGERGLEVEIVESNRYWLRVTPSYRDLANQIHATPNVVSADDREHVQRYVNRSKQFIQNLNQRRLTLEKVTRCIVERQQVFLDRGIRYLVPLTRADIAAEVGLHESTVSRATNGKFVMLPNRQVVPFSTFFSAALSVKDVLKEIILAAPDQALTDQELADQLAERGIHIARRTVAKYRNQLRILPASLR